MSSSSPSSFDELNILNDSEHPPTVDAQLKLRAALRMAEEHRDVANWLFSHDDNSTRNPFHKGAILPPSAFETTTAIEFTQNLSNSTVQAPTVSFHVLFLPFKTIDDVALGYMFCLGQPVSDTDMTPILPNAIPDVAGRFALDKNRDQFIGVVHSSQCGTTSIITHTWKEQGYRERTLFAVPKASYSFDNMPTHVLAILTNPEFRLSSPQVEWSEENQPLSQPQRYTPPIDVWNAACASRPDATEFDNHWEDGLLNVVSPQPFEAIDDALGLNSKHSPVVDCATTAVPPQGGVRSLRSSYGSDSLGVKYLAVATKRPRTMADARISGTAFSTAGGFDFSGMADSLGKIERSFKGTFFGPQMAKDVINPITGASMSRVSGQVRAMIVTADALHSRCLQETAVQLYYSSVMSAVTDQHLARRQLQHDVLTQSSLINEDTDEDVHLIRECEPSYISQTAKRPRAAPVLSLAPRPFANPVAPPLVASRIAPGQRNLLDPSTASQAKLEAKRRSNRLSAARSNERKQARWKAQEKELEALKVRAEELRLREGFLAMENTILRQQVEGGAKDEGIS